MAQLALTWTGLLVGAALWLGLLIATDFNMGAVGVGLLVGLFVTDRARR